MVSIGAHVYGGTFNSASVIGGTYGNHYNDYLAVFDTAKLSKSQSLQWVAMKTQETETRTVGTKIVLVVSYIRIPL